MAHSLWKLVKMQKVDFSAMRILRWGVQFVFWNEGEVYGILCKIVVWLIAVKEGTNLIH